MPGYYYEHVTGKALPRTVDTKLRVLCKQIDLIDQQSRELEDQKAELEDQISNLLTGESVIRPGMVISWEYGKTGAQRKGVVISVQLSNGYRRDRGSWEYHCHILSASGAVVGNANIDDGNSPMIVSSKESPVLAKAAKKVMADRAKLEEKRKRRSFKLNRSR